MTIRRPKAMLFSHLCYPSHITGAEKMLLFIARELQPYFECIVVVPNQGMLSAAAVRLGIHTIVHPIRNLFTLCEPDAHIEETIGRMQGESDFGSLVSLLHMHQPDLVVTNTCVNVLPAAAAKIVGIPVAWVIAETIIKNSYTPSAISVINRYSDWIIGISHSTLEAFQSAGIAHKQFVLFPSWREEEVNSANWEYERYRRRQGMGISANAPVVGYISSDIYPNKGLEHFVRMGLMLCDGYPDAHFMIAGNPTDAGYFEGCMQLISQNGRLSRFSVVPFTQDIPSLYPAMDIVVIPSLVNEGFGLTAQEGLLFGKAVVAYRSGGLVEVLTSTGNGFFLADQGDISGLTVRVGQLLADPQLRRDVSMRNYRTVREVFGLEAYRIRLSHLLSQIMPVLEANMHPAANAVRKWPDGMLVKGAASTAIFFLQDGRKRPYLNEADFHFYRNRRDKVVLVSDADLQAYPTATPILNQSPYRIYAPGTLAARGSGRTVYFLHGGVRRKVPSERALRSLGFGMEEVVPLPDIELAAYPLGAPIPKPAAARRRSKRIRTARRGKKPGRFKGRLRLGKGKWLRRRARARASRLSVRRHKPQSLQARSQGHTARRRRSARTASKKKTA